MLDRDRVVAELTCIRGATLSVVDEATIGRIFREESSPDSTVFMQSKAGLDAARIACRNRPRGTGLDPFGSFS